MIYLLERVEDAQEEVSKIKDGLKCEKVIILQDSLSTFKGHSDLSIGGKLLSCLQSRSFLNLFSSVDNMRTRMFIGCGLVFFQQVCHVLSNQRHHSLLSNHKHYNIPITYVSFIVHRATNLVVLCTYNISSYRIPH